ncbi:hypothetical protein SAMN02745883_01638 [Caminicella sporogenes DSM 14501]|uniref:Uncharacterized protein n=1 Tax=Caminicella sporogenes DSM 14501 TaxID=1121266 RepID=A0A1M6QWQ6_9FIRM|nr:hypothetical protein [Caminicella sporogenes]RKD20884.1 hypothetical protein BET04_08605 [Caminicella sporogenes]SHK24507.1 hypothetical protein SAMN02745883_01638 [Caminicella sporogenes DSM 14501]
MARKKKLRKAKEMAVTYFFLIPFIYYSILCILYYVDANYLKEFDFFIFTIYPIFFELYLFRIRNRIVQKSKNEFIRLIVTVLFVVILFFILYLMIHLIIGCKYSISKAVYSFALPFIMFTIFFIDFYVLKGFGKKKRKKRKKEA